MSHVFVFSTDWYHVALHLEEVGTDIQSQILNSQLLGFNIIPSNFLSDVKFYFPTKFKHNEIVELSQITQLDWRQKFG